MRKKIVNDYLRRLLIIGVFGALIGCGDDNPLGRQRVVGVIKLNGSLLEKGTIAFTPVDPTSTSSGASIEAGLFEIPAEKGLPPGEYYVRISASDDNAEPVELPGESNKIAAELIPARYNTQTEEKFTVSAEAENNYELDISAP